MKKLRVEYKQGSHQGGRDVSLVPDFGVEALRAKSSIAEIGDCT